MPSALLRFLTSTQLPRIDGHTQRTEQNTDVQYHDQSSEPPSEAMSHRTNLACRNAKTKQRVALLLGS